MNNTGDDQTADVQDTALTFSHDMAYLRKIKMDALKTLTEFYFKRTNGGLFLTQANFSYGIWILKNFSQMQQFPEMNF